MKKKWKQWMTAALAGMMVLSLAACGSDGQGETVPLETEKSGSAESVSGESGSGEADATGGDSFSAGKTLIVGLQGDPASFNPVGAPDDWGYYVAENLFSRLVKQNWNGEALPDLAQSWDISEDGLTYTFHLHENAKWHDGEALTASDVKWTFDKILTEKAYLSSYLGSVESIEATDDHTAVFKLSTPDAALLSNISFLGAFILPEHVYEGQDWLTCAAATTSPVGSGPFKLTENMQGVSITMEANADYYGGAPAYDRLIYQIIPDSNTAVQAFNNGELDVLGVMVSAGQIASVESASDAVVVRNSNFGRYYYGFNMKSETVSDVKVREALTMAVNRQEVVDKAFGATGKLAEGYYTPAVKWAYNADAKIPEYDQARAVELLEEAGLKKDGDGYYLTVTIATFNLEPFTNITQIMQANLKEIGVNLVINTMDAGAFMEIGYSGEGYDMYAMGGQVGPDPSMFFHRIGTGGSMNFSWYSNEEVDAMFAEAASLTDQDARAELYKKIQDVCAQDYIFVPLSEDIGINVYKDYLTGLPYDTAVDKAAQTEMTYVTFTREPTE